MSAEVAATLREVARDGFHGLRHAAREHFMARGWPNSHVEAYKYTSLTRLGEKQRQRPKQPGDVGDLPESPGRRLLWVDGYAKDAPPVEYLTLLRDCAAAPVSALTELLGQLAPQDDPVVALNTALFDHGAWIELPADAAPAEPVEMVHALGHHDRPSETHARLAIRLGNNARLTLVERFIGDCDDALLSRVSEIALEAGAELLHVRINQAGDGSQILGHTSVHVGERAVYRCLTLDLGAKLSREAFQVNLGEDAASTELAGLALTDGQRHADSDVLITHNATHTVSRQDFRGILDGRSRSVYSGKVRVAPGAQKSDSAQNSANLLLSPKAEADTRPQLEIYADDVACNHGAATGALDPDALFYLASRGIPADAAQRMIALGFALHSLDVLGDHALRKPLTGLLAARMQAPAEVLEWL